MIKNLKIENFRCIPYFELENVKPINIFVGRNNTGKSSILEAVALAYTSPTGFLDVFGNDLLKVFIERRGGFDNIDYFIRVGEKEANIEINKEIKLRILYKEKDFPSEHEKTFKELVLKHIDENRISLLQNVITYWLQKREGAEEKSDREKIETIEKISKSKKLLLIAYKNDDILSYYLIVKKYPIMKSNEMVSNIIFEGENIVLNLKEIYNSLVSRGEIINLIKILKEKLYIEDLRVANGEIYVFQEGVKKPVPLSLMGDGFLALLKKIVINLYIDKGIVILEEPENHMHPGYLEFMVKELSESAREGKMQLFISTHSLELIENFLEIDENRSFLQIIRMFRDGEDIEYEIMGFDEAKESVEELGEDLRGI